VDQLISGHLKFHFSHNLHSQIRAVVSTCCLVELWAIGFIGVKFFPHMLALIGMHGCMIFFAVSTLVAVFFVIFCVPETKGKSIEAIVERLDAN
jgi:Sugar (and other) transporter